MDKSDYTEQEKKIAKEISLINNHASVYAATHLQTMLVKAYDDIILQFYSSFYPMYYRRHDISYKTHNRFRVPNNEGINLYRAADRMSKHIGQGIGSHSGGIVLTTKDMQGNRYRLAKELGNVEAAKDYVLKAVLDGYRFPPTKFNPSGLTFTAKYDGIAGTPLVVLNLLTEKYWEQFVQDGYEDAVKTVKTEYIKFT